MYQITPKFSKISEWNEVWWVISRNVCNFFTWKEVKEQRSLYHTVIASSKRHNKIWLVKLFFFLIADVTLSFKVFDDRLISFYNISY